MLKRAAATTAALAGALLLAPAAHADDGGSGVYERTLAGRPDNRYKGTATATWTVEWTAPALNDGGTFTETRETAFGVRVGEVQVLN